jgi:hypothetical protein
VRDSFWVDLRSWMLADHAAVQERFRGHVADRVPGDRWHEHADGGGSSIAWLVFHLSLHQDLAIQTAVRGRSPLAVDWRPRLGVGTSAPHEGLGEAELGPLAEQLDPAAVARYAMAVHEATASWLSDVAITSLDATPDAAQRLIDLAGVTAEAVPWLHSMWAGKESAWFVQWEAIGHGHTHVGEMVSIRNRLGLSPF